MSFENYIPQLPRTPLPGPTMCYSIVSRGLKYVGSMFDGQWLNCLGQQRVELVPCHGNSRLSLV
jgi:hypothetical protein